MRRVDLTTLKVTCANDNEQLLAVDEAFEKFFLNGPV